MSTKVNAIVTGVLGVLVLALGGTLLITRQANSSALNRESGQISRQATQLAHQAREITKLQTQATSVQAIAKTAAKGTTGAVAAHLGICVASGDTGVDSAGDNYSALQSWDISSPQISAGVTSCPAGAFVSVVPGKN